LPRNRGKATTLIASLTPTGLGPTATRLGSTTKEVFLACLREELAPALEPGQVVVLGNPGAHRSATVRAIVEERGATALSLPAYPPDLNPIELVFGTPKAALRRAGARTREALEAAIREALAAVTPEQIRAFFAHCGYPLQGLALRQGR
jgi:transposase